MAIDEKATNGKAEQGVQASRQGAQTAPLRLEEDEKEAKTVPVEPEAAQVEAEPSLAKQERAVGEEGDGDAWWASSPTTDDTLLSSTSVTQIGAAMEETAAGQAETAEPGQTNDNAEPPSDPNQLPPPSADRHEQGTRYLVEDAVPELRRTRSMQGLAAIAARDIGRVRSTNQDSVFSLLTNLPREGGDVRMGLFIVADGMGGHEGGEIASKLAVRTVVYHVLAQLLMPALDDGPIEALQSLMINAVQEANTTIWEQAQAQGTDMGTTCTAVLLVGNGLYIAHVGDSRAYMHVPEGLRLVTTDHSTVGRLIAMGQLDSLEAREHPLRNQLYRTVGQQPQISVDFTYEPLGASSHLLLCSDGLWGLVEDAELAQALTGNLWPQDACNELIALANLAGGEDNISAVVVSLPIAGD
jgi:serine/threonine protein phosphatase PrpC